jgi:hypothetical protein
VRIEIFIPISGSGSTSTSMSSVTCIPSTPASAHPHYPAPASISASASTRIYPQYTRCTGASRAPPPPSPSTCACAREHLRLGLIPSRCALSPFIPAACSFAYLLHLRLALRRDEREKPSSTVWRLRLSRESCQGERECASAS